MRLEVDLDQGQVEPWPVFLDYLSYSISNVIMLLLLTMMSLGQVRKVPHIKVALRWRHQQRAHQMAIMYRRVLIEHQDSCEANKQCNIKRLIWAKEVALIRDRFTPGQNFGPVRWSLPLNWPYSSGVRPLLVGEGSKGLLESGNLSENQDTLEYTQQQR